MRPSHVALVGVGILGIWATYEWRRTQPHEEPAPRVAGITSPLLGVDLRTGDLSRLAQVEWTEVEAVINHLSTDPMARDRAIEELQGLKSGSALYTRAFLQVARGDAVGGWQSLQSIDVAEIPAPCAYAAWRLGIETNVGVDNRFWVAVQAAAESGNLGQLQTARVRGAAGEWEQAVTDYLASDPAQWTTFDLRVMAQAMRLAGWRGEVGTLVLAALKGGRVPPTLRNEAAKLIAPSQAEGAAQASWAAWQSAAAEAPELREVMNELVEQQLALRQRFARGDHRGVLDACAKLDPKETGDETVLLAVLAAASTRDAAAWENWSAELLRRNPQPEVMAWIAQIRTETGM